LRTPCAPTPAPESAARTDAAPEQPQGANCNKQTVLATAAPGPAASPTGSQLEKALAVILTVHCARAAPRNAHAEADDPLRGCALFRSPEEPDVGIHDFVSQIRRLVRPSKECLILALIYIDRAAEQCPGLVINNLTVHRLLLTGILLASKYLDDDGYDNAHYAKVGDISTSEMNALEAALLQTLTWRLHALPQEYAWYNDLICRVVHGE